MLRELVRKSSGLRLGSVRLCCVMCGEDETGEIREILGRLCLRDLLIFRCDDGFSYSSHYLFGDDTVRAVPHAFVPN